MDLVKAALTHLGTLEFVPLLWNPERYRLRRRTRLAALPAMASHLSITQGAWGGEEVFSTEILADSTSETVERRDARVVAEKLERWMEPVAQSLLPPQLLFHWGSFRFRGVLAALDEEWVLFDPDGTPRRGWLKLEMRR